MSLILSLNYYFNLLNFKYITINLATDSLELLNLKDLPLNFKRLHLQSNFTYLLKSNKIGIYEFERYKRSQNIIQESLVIIDFF
jgi:hypothetical protein